MMLRLQATLRSGLVACALVALPAVGASCVGTTPVAQEAPLPVARQLFDSTWPMQVVDKEARAPYEAPGFGTLVARRDYREAVKLSGGTPGLTSARFHADAAALFRQATLATGQAYVEYFDAPLGQDYDPDEKVYLLMVSKVLIGDLEGAKAQAEAVRALPADSPVQPWAGPWLAWIDAGATWPPDLSALPAPLPPVAVGAWPELTERPSYTLTEKEPGSNTLAIDDPTLLLQLALWHDAAAHLAAGDQGQLVDVYGARYRLPAEPAVTSRAELPLELRFGSDLYSPLDGAFMAAVVGDEGGAAIQSFKDTSFIAAVAALTLGDDGTIDNVKAVDLVNDLRRLWRDEQGLAAGTTEEHHPIFADVAQAGMYRDLAYIAEIQGDRETSGKLRIAAKDIERDAAAAPEGLMALTAWDADNQYTIRGSEIIHQQARRAPSLEVVRTAFDLIGIRVSRARGGGGTPGM